MTTIKSSATSSVSAATSITVALGSTPAVGDLVVVWLAVSNEIVTRGPNYNTTRQWFSADQVRLASTDTLSTWYHTWNAADSGSSAVFTFIPAPSLGVGDKGLPVANAVAVGAVLAGPVGLKEHSVGSYLTGGSQALTSPLKSLPTSIFTGCYGVGSPTFTDSDTTATMVATVGGLTVFQATPLVNRYAVIITPSIRTDTAVAALAFNDNPSFLYNPPFTIEGPVSENNLFFRYRMNKYYTVLNNSGTFTAGRYLSTDQINAATQVFVNNAPVSSTDRTNILNSGVGGDFIAS